MLRSAPSMAESERPSPEEIILYAKDPKPKIATITFSRPEFLNAPTGAARLRYADLLHAAGVDDDVKVVVIRYRRRLR
jgi:enoyl-CoA hydratase